MIWVLINRKSGNIFFFNPDGFTANPYKIKTVANCRFAKKILNSNIFAVVPVSSDLAIGVRLLKF